MAGAAAKRIREKGDFELALPPAEAFKLFTAEGERLWVPGWSPEMLAPPPQARGTVFLTGEGAERTIWTVLESDPAKGSLLYSRVTPGSRAGVVEVVLAKAGDRTRVQVGYDLTALSPEGEAALGAYQGARFTGMMEDWRTRIVAVLAREEARAQLAKLIV